MIRGTEHRHKQKWKNDTQNALYSYKPKVYFIWYFEEPELPSDKHYEEDDVIQLCLLLRYVLIYTIVAILH